MNKAENLTQTEIKIVWESDLIEIDYRKNSAELRAMIRYRQHFVDDSVWDALRLNGHSQNPVRSGRLVLLDAGPKVCPGLVKRIVAGNGVHLGGLVELCYFTNFFRSDKNFRKVENFVVALKDVLELAPGSNMFTSILGNYKFYSLGVSDESEVCKYKALFLGVKFEN